MGKRLFFLNVVIYVRNLEGTQKITECSQWKVMYYLGHILPGYWILAAHCHKLFDNFKITMAMQNNCH